MRFIFLILLFTITSLSYGQDITTVHFNYKWNVTNAYKGLDRLKNTKVQYAYVEDQSDAVKKSIKSVPTIVIYKKLETSTIGLLLVGIKSSKNY
jgi:hypothetical protein